MRFDADKILFFASRPMYKKSFFLSSALSLKPITDPTLQPNAVLGGADRDIACISFSLLLIRRIPPLA